MSQSETHYSISSISLNDNERSLVIELIGEINDYLRGKDLPVKRAGGERTINGGSFVKFPDVLLFSDKSQSLILQGWEAKCPDVPIDDPDFVDDAHNKARLLGCNSTVLWNFRHAQLHVCNADGEFEIIENFTIDDRIVDRETVVTYGQEWKTFLHDLISIIAEFISTKKIKHRLLGEALTESIMPKLINDNKGHLAESLKMSAARDITIKTYIDEWWETAQQEYAYDELDPYSAYSKIILINWLNKLLFANLIQNQFDAARIINDISGPCKIREAIDVFDCITESCDFHNVFFMLPYSEYLPDETWEDLVTFNELLLECKMEQLDQSYSHRILEESISVAKRQVAGQYPTPKPLASLLSEIAIRDSLGNAWDCCCGTGTIGCALWERKHAILSEAGIDAESLAYETTWMSDMHGFPLQIATQSLSALSPIKMPLRVFRKDVFAVEPGMPLLLIDPLNGKKEAFQLPRFKSIASNLPFVDFNTSDASIYDGVKEEIKTDLQIEHQVSLSDRNDLYCYITLFLEDLLDDGGYMCLLTSNSWLCTSAGDDFMLALQAKFNIDAIYVNGAHRWFKNADVMNAILVLRKKDANSKSECYMGSIDASIDDLSCDAIRNSISRRIISHSSDCKYVSECLVTWDQMRQLRHIGMSYYTMCHDVAFMLELIDSLCSADSIFRITRATKSGQNSFFYSKNKDFVEDDFRAPLLKDFKGVNTYVLKPSQYAFVCDKPKEYLAENGYAKSLDRINSVVKPNKSCLSHKPYWYTLPGDTSVTFATAMNPHQRLFFSSMPEGESFVADQRAICFSSKSTELDKDLCLALLNSTLGMFLIESSAAPMALGALDTRADTFKKMYMLNPDLISQEQRDEIVSAFKVLKSRNIKDALEEIEEEDRSSFDSVVLKAYGIEQFTDKIKESLRRMLQVRLRDKTSKGSGHL